MHAHIYMHACTRAQVGAKFISTFSTAANGAALASSSAAQASRSVGWGASPSLSQTRLLSRLDLANNKVAAGGPYTVHAHAVHLPSVHC